jgi:hydroxyacylglutathione hydrolase
MIQIRRVVVGQLDTNCYILANSGKALIIDPGDDAKKIEDETRKMGVVIESIINTHNHFDHIGADSELKEKFRVNILIDGSDNAGKIADKEIEDQDVLNIGNEPLRVMHTPGHTPGSVCLFGNGFVLSGDTLFADGFGRTDMSGGSDKDMAASLRKLDSLIPEGNIVYPGHGESFIYRKGAALAWLEYLRQ